MSLFLIQPDSWSNCDQDGDSENGKPQMLLTENQLDEWVRGNSRDAQAVIVELVKRLVSAAVPNPKERRFPLGDSMGQHGPDGILNVDLPFNPFIPEGRSFWEIGTSLDVQHKATDDYKNLVKNKSRTIRKEAVFIFVTPFSARRNWEEKAQERWIETRRERSDWKDIKIIDGTKLIDWMHLFPAVEMWLANQTIKIPFHQVETIEQHWQLLRSIGEPPPLTPQVFLVNRKDAHAKVKEIFADTSVKLRIDTYFPDQMVDFISAAVAELDEEKRADIIGRCLVISSSEAWNTIIDQKVKHILIADSALDLDGSTGTKLIQKARNAGHAIIFSGSPGGIPDPARVSLPQPRAYQLQEELNKAGYGEERARILSQKSGGNLGSLLRCLQNLSSMPEWAEGTSVAELTIAAILGSWNDKCDSDRRILECVAGKPFGEWIEKIREVALCSGTPLKQTNGQWKFVSRYEGWNFLGPRINDDLLNRLKEAAILVLKEKDPQFELPNQDRIMAPLQGKILSHSKLLRTGIAESLALLGNHHKALISSTLGKAERIASDVVEEIFKNADWVQWASLNDVLPLLAEAAPNDFLNAIESMQKKNPCPFDELFAQEGKNSITEHNYMTGLLWAMETLAWDPEYLCRVIILLGDLASRDPGGKWANRPDNSLTTILQPWFPQTCAPVAKRVTAVASLFNEFPDIGWKLIISLLPMHHSVSFGTRKPAWRETIPDTWSDGAKNNEYREQIGFYSELAINIAKNDYHKLSELINHFDTLPQSAQKQLLEYLESEKIIALPDSYKFELWTTLVDLVNKHKKFSKADWAMSAAQIDKVDVVAKKLEPTAPTSLYKRLFTEYDSDLYDEKGDYEAQRKKLELHRQKVIIEIENSGGLEAVLDFASSVQSPRRVGIAFGNSAKSNVDDKILPGYLEFEKTPIAEFSSGFVWGRFFSSSNWSWVDKIITKDWSNEKIGYFLSLLPFAHETWDRVELLLKENNGAYWDRVVVNPYEDKKSLDYAIEQLILHHRPNAAIRCIHALLDDKHPFNKANAIKALIMASELKENINALDVHDIVEIIQSLQNDSEINPSDLFLLEWTYLRLLTHYNNASPIFIERRLANEPKFFCEVIRLVFRSKKKEHQKEEITEDKKNLATHAYHLLSNWRTPPGSQPDGTFNGDALISWIGEVKKECSDSGHLEIAMEMIGHVLVYTPPDPSGLWINHSAAKVLNDKEAERMRNGFCIELSNSRGFHWVDKTGKQEREYEARYKSKAESVESCSYFLLANSLRQLAKSYHREAERVTSIEDDSD